MPDSSRFANLQVFGLTGMRLVAIFCCWWLTFSILFRLSCRFYCVPITSKMSYSGLWRLVWKKKLWLLLGLYIARVFCCRENYCWTSISKLRRFFFGEVNGFLTESWCVNSSTGFLPRFCLITWSEFRSTFGLLVFTMIDIWPQLIMCFLLFFLNILFFFKGEVTIWSYYL